MSINYQIIGKRIKEIRKNKNITQEKLAELAGISTQFTSQIETASRQASLKTLVNIVNSLGITLNELLYGNQLNDPSEYQNEIWLLLEDCSSFEKRFIFELIIEVKRIMRENKSLDN